ncbi:phage holin family protein [Kitasatospora sp. MBT63]|uniref:phage holin family protein n=1 Tax=Kitasatospora sp. MBT63 TaxID=1444768 RepID=UPI00053B552A|nr:phage holin family protein [Kitasatospora sp. MBT63]
MALSYSEHTARGAGPPAGGRPSPGPAPGARAPADPGQSLGDLISHITTDVGQLVRNEIELAKAEIKQEAVKAGKASGMLAGAGYAGHLVLLLGSLTLVFALGNVMNIAWAALLVTVLWAATGAVLYTAGRKRLKEVHLTPEQTLATVKEDAAWARHPIS